MWVGVMCVGAEDRVVRPARVRVDDALDTDRAKTLLGLLPMNEAAMSVLDTADANRHAASPGIMHALDLATTPRIRLAADTGEPTSAVLFDTTSSERLQVHA